MRAVASISLAVVLLVASAAAVSADPPRVAVGDFTVLSDNPTLKYVGKGFAELVAAQFTAAKGVQLIDRDRRAALLGELEFSLSDAADATKQAEVGRLLAADYLVFGEIIEMGQEILLSCKMIRVETGEVVWADRHLGALTDYDGLSRRIASSALKTLGAGKAAAAVAAAPKAASKASAEKKVEAVLAFSRAVDALDRKDKAEARKQIKVAKAIDPTNRAVAIYAAKLHGGSPRFQVELENFAPGYNPALLGLIEKASFYSWSSISRLTGSDLGEYQIVYIDTDNGMLKHKEQGTTQNHGVLLPLGRRFGVLAEFSMVFYSDYAAIEPPGPPVLIGNSSSDVNLDQKYFGGSLGAGCQIAPGLGIGVDFRLTGLTKNTGEGSVVASWMDFYPEEAGPSFSVTGGAAYRGPQGRLSADLEVVWSTQPDFYVLSPAGGIGPADPGTLVRGDKPLLLSLGTTGAFLGNTLFANLKLIGEIGLDSRDFFSVRVIPGVEWWPFKWVGLRAGYEQSYVTAGVGSVNGGGDSASGNGFMGGFTLSFRGFDLNANYISRYRPFNLLPGTGHQDSTFLFGVTYSGLLERR